MFYSIFQSKHAHSTMIFAFRPMEAAENSTLQVANAMPCTCNVYVDVCMVHCKLKVTVLNDR